MCREKTNMNNNSNIKICSHCKKNLPIDLFYKNKSKKDGYQDNCKSCHNSYNKYNKEYHSKYYKNHEDKIKEYREKNIEKVREWKRNYYKNHKDEVYKSVQKYNHTPRGKLVMKIRDHKRRNVLHDFTLDQLEQKLLETKGTCPGYNCNSHYVGLDNLTLDHNPPISSVQIGFVYHIEDIEFLCRKCNCKKSDWLT